MTKNNKDLSHYQKHKKYYSKYNKYYYLKKILEDPDYNKKRKLREKEKKIKNSTKENSN